MRITALAGGVGGARFLRGLRDHLDETGRRAAELTIIGNTGDDITLFGLRVCPDLDTLAYTLGDVVHEDQGWGRANERFTLAEEFTARGTAAVANYATGPGFRTGVTIGPLIEPRAVAKTGERVADAVARGATLRVGGHALEGAGSFFEAAIP